MAIDFQPPLAAIAGSNPPPKARLLAVHSRVRVEMDQLDLDERRLALWAGMTEKSIRAILESGTATRGSVRRIRRGLRMAWLDKVGTDKYLSHWRRLTFAYLTSDGTA